MLLKLLTEYVNFALNPNKDYKLHYVKIHYIYLYKVFKITFKDYKNLCENVYERNSEEIKHLKVVLLNDLDILKKNKIISNSKYHEYLAQL